MPARKKSVAGISLKTGHRKAAAPAAGPTKNYDAARFDRLVSEWQVSRLSADAELQGRVPIIRSRSRDSERNEPLTENFLNLVENNVVGHCGFVFEAKAIASTSIDPDTGEEAPVYDAPANREIERAWGRFCQRDNFLTTRDHDATSAFKLIARTAHRDGDCLIRKVAGYPNDFGFALQLLEPDFLDDQYIDFRGVPCQCPEQLTLPNGRPFPRCKSGMHQVRMGVELQGDWMFPLAYWILADHPGDYFFGNQFSVRRTRVPVDEMIHPFITKRMGQTRGVPALVAAMVRLQMLGGYDEATLVKARAAAQKIGFLEKEIPDSIADQFAEQLGEKNPIMDSEPGGILDLPPGVAFKAWDPQDPSPQYDPFTKRQTRMVAAAGGVSYTSLSNDIENVNFSSIRAGLLEEREGWKGRQAWMIAEVVRPIFEAWLPMAILSGQCKVPMSRLAEFLDHAAAHFQGRRWPWVDPMKDVQANVAAIDAGLTSRTRVIAETGADFEDVAATLAREKKILTAAGIMPQADPAPIPGASQPDNAPAQDAAPPAQDAPAAPKSVMEALGGRVGHMQQLMKVVAQVKDGTVPREKAGPLLQQVFGLDAGASESLLKLLLDEEDPVQQVEIAPDMNRAVKSFADDELLAVQIKCLKRDGWVTINGTAVHIGDDGVIDKGPEALIAHSRSRKANKASDAAHRASSAANSSPTHASHWAAGIANRDAGLAHAQAALSMDENAEEHLAKAKEHLARVKEHREAANKLAPAPPSGGPIAPKPPAPDPNAPKPPALPTKPAPKPPPPLDPNAPKPPALPTKPGKPDRDSMRVLEVNAKPAAAPKPPALPAKPAPKLPAPPDPNAPKPPALPTKPGADPNAASSVTNGKHRFTPDTFADHVGANPVTEEAMGVSDWGSSSRYINDSPNSSKSKAFLGALRQIAPVDGKDAAVYRGNEFNTAAERDAFVAKIVKEGGYQVDSVARSFSRSMSVARQFAGGSPEHGVIFHIEKGHKRMVDISKAIAKTHSGLAHEQEVVALHGQKFKLVGRSKHKGMTVLHLRELP